MRDFQLVLHPFRTVNVINCKITRAVNEHAHLYFHGCIQSDKEDEYLKLGLSDVPVVLAMTDESNSVYTLFQGITKNIRIRAEGDLRQIEVEAVSSSYYMDLVNHTRVFQDVNTSYDALLSFIGKNYSANHIMTAGDGTTIGNLIVQYHETDWAFAKRLASHFHSVVVPAYKESGFRYFFGVPNGKQNIALADDSYTIKKEAGEYLKKTQNDAGDMSESDSICLEITSRDVYDIGDSFPFRGQPFYIYSIESNFASGELVHLYHLKTRAGIQVSKSYNEFIIGASLDAAITGVSKDTVKVKVNADGIQTPAKWFPYSTVYSSPDGTGWYCMPEVGDSVRMYMPSDKEEEAFIISSVHVSEGAGGARNDPDSKSLKSKYGKEVLFTPGTLLVTNNNGMSVEIIDEEGIKIISDKAIVLQSEAGIQIASTKDSIAVVAQKSIALSQGNTSMTLENDIHLTGAQVHME